MSDRMYLVLAEIERERKRQEQLHGNRTAAHPESMDDGHRLAILTEEVGEVAKEICEAPKRGEASDGLMREELVQVAAVAVAWIEAIDARAAR